MASPKPIGPKTIHQKDISTRLAAGDLEIIFQVELNSDGNTVITFFKGVEKTNLSISKDIQDNSDNTNA